MTGEVFEGLHPAAAVEWSDPCWFLLVGWGLQTLHERGGGLDIRDPANLQRNSPVSLADHLELRSLLP